MRLPGLCRYEMSKCIAGHANQASRSNRRRPSCRRRKFQSAHFRAPGNAPNAPRCHRHVLSVGLTLLQHANALRTPPFVLLSEANSMAAPAAKRARTMAAPTTSWVPIAATSDFSMQNIPFGIISTEANATPRVATAIGEHVGSRRLMPVTTSSEQPHARQQVNLRCDCPR